MAITDEPTAAQGAAADTHFCPQCGHQTANGRFCPGCGADLMDDTQPMGTASGPPPPPPHMYQSYGQAHAEPAPPPPRPHATGTKERPNSKVAVIVAAGAFGLAAVVAAVIIILSASSSNTNSASTYTSKLSSALAPVLAANTTLSQSLQTLSGKNTQTAKSGDERRRSRPSRRRAGRSSS